MLETSSIHDANAYPDLELAPLRLLAALATLGTVTEAAARLHLSQPAATHQLRKLERHLGQALVRRQGRGVALTPAGRAAAVRAGRILAELAGLRDDLRALAGLEAGEVRVGAGSTAAIHLLPGLIAAFRARHPGVAFFVREGVTPETLAAVAEGSLDVGIVGLPSAHPGVDVVPWLTDTLMVVAWPGAPLAGRTIAAAALEGAPFIAARVGPLRDAVDAGFRAAGVAPRPVMALESVEAAKACVAAGLGYAVLGSRAIARDLAEGRLVALDVRDLPLARDFGIATRAGSRPSAAVAAFLAAMRDG